MFLFTFNRISGVMVSVLTSSAADHGFEPRLGQTKDYEIGICCFSAKHAALRRKRKDWLAQNQNNVQGSTLKVVRLPGASEMRLRASENGTQLVRSGKWKCFCDMFNSWRAKWLILNYSVSLAGKNKYDVDAAPPPNWAFTND
jgi:hypothetical protein